MLGRWGILPIAVPAALFLAGRLGSFAFPEGRRSDRAVAGWVLAAGLIAASVRILGALHALTGGALLALLLVAAISVAIASVWPVARIAVNVAPGRLALKALVTASTAPLLAAAIAAVGIAVIAAVWLPVWQWDALGYHLPYVDFALVAHGFDGIPTDMPYVSTYPHVVETLIIALRAMLPDDRLVDLAQIPFALAGALATACIARRLDASPPSAVAAGAAWILAPAVFLQMPTDYVDVASAAFFLSATYFVLAASTSRHAPPSTVRRHVILGGLALGLYVGTKPNAPPSAAILAATLAWLGFRARQRASVFVALVLVVAGCETFVENALRYGNPVWPVEVKIGPFTLHGISSMQHLLDSGAAAPHLHGPLLWRIARSWTALTSAPVFDMRIGGFGPLVLVALPAAAVTVMTLLRRKDPVLACAIVAAVAAPDPSVARYVLAFPAIVLAAAAPRAVSVPARIRPWLGAAAGLVAVWQIGYALPGLTGEGPTITAYARMTEAERAEAVGADGSPAPFVDVRARVGAGETFAFDQSMELPYLAWEPDLRYRAVWIPDTLSAGAVEGFFDRENVRVAAVADESPTSDWLSRQPERFLKLFHCKSSPCSVFARR